MYQVFRMELRRIIGGKKKWLVLLLLAVPVLLTWVNMSFGGLDTVRQRDGIGRARNDPSARPSPNARRVSLDDAAFPEPLRKLLTVRDGRLLLQGHEIGTNQNWSIAGGWFVIKNGRLWRDDSRRPRRARRLRNIRIRPLGQVPRLPWLIICSIYLFLLYPQTVCLLLALFYGSSLLGSELDNKTLTYLCTRPIARWRWILGKYLAIVAALIPPTLISLSASYYLLGAPESPALLLGLGAGAVGGLLAYNAIFVLLGFVAPRRAMVLALIYGVVFEFLMSFVPALVNNFTITYYLRSLVVDAVDLEIPAQLSRVVGGASAQTACLAIGAMVVFGLGFSALLAKRREYVVTGES